MPTKTPTAVYRSLVQDAWRLTRTRKTLWVFGIFAGLLSTGGVVENSIRTFNTVERGREFFIEALHGSIPGLTAMGQLIHSAAALGPGRATGLIVSGIIVLLLLLLASIASQAGLVMGVQDATPKSLNETRREGHGHALQILILTILSKGATLILLILSALPLTLFSLRGTAMDAVLFLLIFLVLIPASIAVSTISTLALFSIVRNNRSAIDGIHHATTLFRTHWVACLEFGLLLFCLSLLGTLALFFLVLLAVIPFTLLIFGVLMLKIPLLYALVNALGILTFFTVMFLGFGAMITFQYASWSLFHERLLLKGAAKLKAKIHRLWAKR